MLFENHASGRGYKQKLYDMSKPLLLSIMKIRRDESYLRASLTRWV